MASQGFHLVPRVPLHTGGCTNEPQPSRTSLLLPQAGNPSPRWSPWRVAWAGAGNSRQQPLGPLLGKGGESLSSTHHVLLTNPAEMNPLGGLQLSAKPG